MKKSKVITQYVCQNCGNSSPRWLGKCPECESWNTYVEEQQEKTKTAYKAAKISDPIPITEIESGKEDRIPTNNNELDRVLGGGFVPGSVILVGGDPGIGKSTLALQMLNDITASSEIGDSLNLLYVTGEESPEQVKLRAERIGISSEQVFVLSATSVESILEKIKALSPQIAVIDSIQTMYTEELASAPGSVGQIRECTAKLMHHAKTSGPAIFLVGHVTKEGAIAGPKVLEHLVDTVLYFEGGKDHPYRILRAIKNRFGSTNEIGVFEMMDVGLKEVKNPSEIFLSERPENASGSVVTPSIEGTRPILVEIQALVSPCSFGVPRRTTIGLDNNRVSLLLAVLEKRAGLQILGQDVFMNVAGGVKIEEPAIDLAISIALVSSFLNKPLDPGVVVFGEIGLAGEVRGVSQIDMRINEAQKLGFTQCVVPKVNLDRVVSADNSISLIGVDSIEKAIEVFF
ncbi:MAG: DNA repair protein RadA [Thermodesulfobacteriota bacterium]|nr:MAG: DNA repair protein RadA [Thermodesulfobacteriota bacterium]